MAEARKLGLDGKSLPGVEVPDRRFPGERTPQAATGNPRANQPKKRYNFRSIDGRGAPCVGYAKKKPVWMINHFVEDYALKRGSGHLNIHVLSNASRP